MHEVEIKFSDATALRKFKARFTECHTMPEPFASKTYAFFGDAADKAEDLALEIEGAAVLTSKHN